MATDLRDRLGDLAAHTPPGIPPVDLWDRGVRRRRATRAATAALVAAVVLLVGVGGWAFRTGEQRVEPTDTHGAPHLPDRFFQPSPWLHSFDGPPGQLVAIGTAQHRSLFHTRTDVYGVTAAGGAYGFLDLPGSAVAGDLGGATAPALSPDGSRVAFWTTGTPSGTPNTHLLGVTITGVSVYDTVTGHVDHAELSTVHGLSPGLLTWSDDRTLVLGINQATHGDENPNSCCEGHWQGLASWRVGVEPQPIDLPADLPTFVDYSSTTAGYGRVVTTDSERHVDVIRPRPPVVDRRFRLSAPTASGFVVTDGRRVAAVKSASRGLLQVGDLPSSRGTGASGHTVPLRTVPGAGGFSEPLAWLDSRHVAVVRGVDLRDHRGYRLDSVDVRTGAARTLVRVDHGDHQVPATAVDLARDLLGAPGAHASPPPRPWDLRGVAIGVLIGAACLALAIWGVRGRRA